MIIIDFFRKKNALSFVAGLVIGILLLLVSDPYLPAKISNFKKGYNIGFDGADINKNITSANCSEVYSVAGTVISTNSDNITIKVHPNYFNKNEDKNKLIFIDNNTNIIKNVEVDEKTYNKIMPGVKPPTVKLFSTTTPVYIFSQLLKLKDIKIGDNIIVTSKTIIKTDEQINASLIVIE